MRVDENLCRLAIKSAIVTGQNYGTFSTKVWRFWVACRVLNSCELTLRRF